MTTDDLESSLRAGLQTLTVRHDDERAEQMIAAASTGRPLPQRRAMLAPLAAAAAVATVGVTAAVIGTGGDDPAPTDPPAAAAGPTTYPAGSLAFAAALTVPTSGDRFVTRPLAASQYQVDPGATDGSSGELGRRIRVKNPQGDAATVRVTNAKGVVVFDADLEGRAAVTTYGTSSTDLTDLSTSVQCRRPGRGDRCRLTLAVGNIDFDTRPLPTIGATQAGTDPAPSTGRASTSACPGCEIP